MMRLSVSDSVKTSAAKIFNELLILFLFIFVINNFLGNEDVRINSDGKGYYDYLPSIFIYHDFVRYDCNKKECPERYSRIDKMGFYNSYKDGKVNKYSCGTAILESPFFLTTFLFNERTHTEDEAYQTHYQHAIFYAALFYLFLALLFLKALLKLYAISPPIITTMQLSLVFATGLSYYANYNAGYSHVFSLFAITAFCYLTKRFLMNHELRYFYFTLIALAFVILIRPANALIILVVPFLAGNFSILKNGIHYIIRKPLNPVSGIILLTAILSVQCMAWKAQTGDLFLYSYVNEGFNWFNPQIANVLFSFRKGLFVYSPVLIIATLSVLWLFFIKRSYEGIMWILFFFIITYFISSWRSWSYGGSYGMRPYIDFLTLFIIPLALFLQHSKNWIRAVIIVLIAGLAVINQIQTYQYKEYILTWDSMTEEGYRKVFLRTGDQMKGVLWKEMPDISSLKSVDYRLQKHIGLDENTTFRLFTSGVADNEELKELKYLKLSFITGFDSRNDSEIQLAVIDTAKQDTLDFQRNYVMKMLEKEMNTLHRGELFFKTGPIAEPDACKIIISVMTRKQKIIIDDPVVFLYFK